MSQLNRSIVMKELIEDLEEAICSLLEEKTIAEQHTIKLQQQLSTQAAQIEPLESQLAAFQCERNGLTNDKVAAQQECALRSKQLEELESDFHQLRLRYLRHRRG